MITTFPLKGDKSPAVPRGTDWREYTGPVDTPMIGVVIPQGVFIIDLDLYKGLTYEQLDEELGVEIDWEASLLQTTLNGGAHHAFAVPVGVTLPNSKNVIVKGLDTRSSGKGYIATGEGYTDHMDDDVPTTLELGDMILPELGEEALDLFLTQSSDRSLALADGGDLLGLVSAVANDDTLGLSDDEIRDYLECLPEDAGENDWLNVVMAVYHETSGSEEGYKLLDNWSKNTGGVYDEPANRRRWDSASNTGANPITFRTVIKMAGGKESVVGLVGRRLVVSINECCTRECLERLTKDVANAELSTIDEALAIDALRTKFQEVVSVAMTKSEMKKELKRRRRVEVAAERSRDSFVDAYVFCTQSGLYVNRDSLSQIPPRSFNTLHNRETPPDAEGAMQYATTFADRTITCVDETMYLPSAGEIFSIEGLSYYNTFRPIHHDHVEVGTSNAVEMMLSHAQWQLPDPSEREILLSFIAHQVQNRGKLLQWALVLQGAQGDGKSYWAELMTHLLGHNNVGTVTSSQFGNRFNAWAQGKCVNVIEELKVGTGMSQYDVLNHIKPLITNPKITVEGKGANSKDAINCTNYFATTNYRDAVPIDSYDRRWCVLFTEHRDVQLFVDENPTHFSDIYDSMRGNVAEIFTFFSTYKIPSWFSNLARAPITKNRGEMIENSKSHQEVLVEIALVEINNDFANESRVDATYLNSKIIAFSEAGDDRFEDFPKPKHLKKILMGMGYIHAKREWVNSKQHTIYRK